MRLRRRQHHAADHLAGAKSSITAFTSVERSRGNRNRRHAGAAHQLDQFLHLRQAADIGPWIVMARIGIGGSDTVISPPNSPTMMYLPPLIRLSKPSRALCDDADEIDHRPGTAIGHVDDLLRRVGGAAVDHRDCARLSWRPRA